MHTHAFKLRCKLKVSRVYISVKWLSFKNNGEKITTIAVYNYNYWKDKQNTVANYFFQKKKKKSGCGSRTHFKFAPILQKPNIHVIYYCSSVITSKWINWSWVKALLMCYCTVAEFSIMKCKGWFCLACLVWGDGGVECQGNTHFVKFQNNVLISLLCVFFWE